MIVTKKFVMQHCCSLVLYSHDRTSLRRVYVRENFVMEIYVCFVVFHRLLCVRTRLL